MVQFAEFQKHQKTKLDFDDITLDFYRKYISWMTKKKYSSNTIGRYVKDLKTIMDNAKDENLHDNDEYKNKKFKVTSEEADNVYLTFDELKAIMEVDLSGKAKGYSDAKDVFLAGCWLAQRVSDYNHMTPENIITEKIKTIEGDGVVESEAVCILLVQQKTKMRVKIPANNYMRNLLIKCNNQLPYIWKQKLNQYIKDVAEMAGITELVPITSTKGGKEETTLIVKNKLIKSHTARRTGATLMYLSGMDIYDICKITGHTSVKNLRKYIKADELDVAEKIRKYNYFN